MILCLFENAIFGFLVDGAHVELIVGVIAMMLLC